jgi:hypothetical protein
MSDAPVNLRDAMRQRSAIGGDDRKRMHEHNPVSEEGVRCQP